MEAKTALDFARLGAAALMDKFTPETLPPTGRFHYHQGVFLAGIERLYGITGEEKYRDYIKEWVDLNIDENGNSDTCYLTEFDDIQPGILLFDLYRTTGDKRYKIMLDKMYDAIKKWPTNAKGGVWHKYYNENQMWLDTMYMMGVFSAIYAAEFGDAYMFEKIYHQMKLMRDNMTDKVSGLLYHMWDDSKAETVVDRETGLIKICWGRAIGWYVVALAEIIGYIPEDNPLRNEFITVEKELLSALAKYQDKESGLWYQVVNRPKENGNWTESSCTALFTYAIAKSLNLGIIPPEFKGNALKGYEGVLLKTEMRGNTLIMKDICIGTAFGDIQYYLDRPKTENDLHGIGAFLLMCTEIYKIADN